VSVNNTSVSPTTQGLIGYWNFDEGTGTIAHDTSGNGWNGNLSGATWTTGKINAGLSFNAASTVTTSSIPLGGTFSISSWVNPAGNQGGYARIAETNYDLGFYLGANSGGTKYKLIVNNARGATGTCGAGVGCAEGGTITSGWHLVVATFDGTTGRLYVDNVLVASDTFTPPASISLPLYIGENSWNGGVDEVRLYNRALTTAEISTIFNSH
jgi:hypothetical protein